MKRTPTERAIIYAAILGGLDLSELNSLLPVEARPLPESSYQMLRTAYFRSLVAGIGQAPSPARNGFGDLIFRPKPFGDLDF